MKTQLAHDPTTIAIGGGLSNADRPLIEQTLRQAHRRLDLTAMSYAGELSVRDRDKPGMKTTLEIWLRGRPRIVVTSAEPDLRDALNEVGARVVTAVDATLARRRPIRNRVRRFRRTRDATAHIRR